jgi:RNA polymerase sigma-70 factor (ECF subfamily)
MVARARDDRSDEALMLAYAAGEAGAFDVLYGRHKGGVYRYLLRQCASAGVAEELFQDVWLSVVRVRASWQPTAKFTTWVYTLARNRLVDHWRAAGHVQLVPLDGERDDDDAGAVALAEVLAGPRTELPEVRTQSREIGVRLRAALDALPAPQRDAVLLQQEGGLTLEEIAAVSGAGVETVKSRLRYAMAKLRAALADWQENAA